MTSENGFFGKNTAEMRYYNTNLLFEKIFHGEVQKGKYKKASTLMGDTCQLGEEDNSICSSFPLV